MTEESIIREIVSIATDLKRTELKKMSKEELIEEYLGLLASCSMLENYQNAREILEKRGKGEK